MSDEQFKQHPIAGDDELTASTPVEEPVSAEPISGTTTDDGAAGEPPIGGQPKDETPDDFRDALSNLSSALDRFGHAAEGRVRHELKQGKPEINRTVDEMKRGLEGLIRKSGGVFDSVSKRLNRDDEPAASTAAPDATAPNEPTTTPEPGDISEKQHSPVDFPPTTPDEPATTATDLPQPLPPKQADSH